MVSEKNIYAVWESVVQSPLKVTSNTLTTLFNVISPSILRMKCFHISMVMRMICVYPLYFLFYQQFKCLGVLIVLYSVWDVVKCLWFNMTCSSVYDVCCNQRFISTSYVIINILCKHMLQSKAYIRLIICYVIVCNKRHISISYENILCKRVM